MSIDALPSDIGMYEKLAIELEIWARTDQFLLAEFASDKGYDLSLLAKWSEGHERLNKAYKNAIKHEENYIVKRALNGDFDASFARFYLINRHDYRPSGADDSQGIKGPITISYVRPERKPKKKVEAK